jgi:hypothetical protein
LTQAVELSTQREVNDFSERRTRVSLGEVAAVVSALCAVITVALALRENRKKQG